VLFPKRVHERVLLSVNAAQHSFVTNLFCKQKKKRKIVFCLILKKKKQKTYFPFFYTKLKKCVKSFAKKAKNSFKERKTSFSMG